MLSLQNLNGLVLDFFHIFVCVGDGTAVFFSLWIFVVSFALMCVSIFHFG